MCVGSYSECFWCHSRRRHDTEKQSLLDHPCQVCSLTVHSKSTCESGCIQLSVRLSLDVLPVRLWRRLVLDEISALANHDVAHNHRAMLDHLHSSFKLKLTCAPSSTASTRRVMLNATEAGILHR